MADVVLVYPKTGLDKSGVLTKAPLSIWSLIPYLKEEGFSVEYIDQRVDLNWGKSFKNAIKSNPVCVGISSMSGPQILNGLVFSEIVKKFNPAIPVVWGGPHPSGNPRQTLANPLIDIVVIGEGESTFLDVVRHLADKKQLSGVPGINYKINGIIKETHSRDLLEINSIKPIPFHGFDIAPYVNKSAFDSASMMIVPDRGCPYNCSFCSVAKFYGKKIRLASSEKVFDDVCKLVKLGINSIEIGSENFFTNKNRAEEFFRLIIKAGFNLSFKFECSANLVVGYDRSFWELAKKAGVKALQVGVESGSPRMLKYMKKRSSVQTIMETNQILKDMEIYGLYSFMIGMPTETIEDVKLTVSMADNLAKSNPYVYIYNFQMYKPFAGTEWFDVAVSMGFKPPENLEEWGGILGYSPAWLSRKEAKIFKKIDLFSYFLDGRLMTVAVNNKFLKKLVKLYSITVRFRLKSGLFGWLLEYPILRLLIKIYIYIFRNYDDLVIFISVNGLLYIW